MWYLFKSKEIMLNPSALKFVQIVNHPFKTTSVKTNGSSFWAGTHMEINATLTFL